MENNSFKYIVYCTTCTVNKKIYIGVHKTLNPDEFDFYIGNGCYSNQPSTYEHPKTKYQFALKKYGASKFIRNTIAVFDNEEDAYRLESEIVNKDFLKRIDVYNTALGGLGGDFMQTALKTYKYDNEGNYVQEYNSILEASKFEEVSFRSIWRAINDKCKCKNYFWTTTKYDKLDVTLMKSYEDTRKIPVFQYSIDGQFDCCYESIHDAARVLNTNHNNISLSIKLGTICNNKYFTCTYSPEYSQARTKQITSCKIYQYDLSGNYIASYKNMQEAKNKLGIKSNIYNAIKLGRTCGNYQWSFELLDKIAPVETPKTGKARKIGKYDKDWNLIEEYSTLQACKNANGSGMVHVLQGRDEFAKGFRYKYI